MNTSPAGGKRAPGRPLEAAAWAFVFALVLVSAWRAYSQAFTIDEAYTFLNYTRLGSAGLFATFHSNHHMLFTILSKLSWKAFGSSELALRAPSVLAGFAFLAINVFIARRIAGSGPARILAFLATAGNPLLLDFLSAARGYGLALAFWSGGLLLAISPPESLRLRALALIGGLFGLSIAANLTFLVPAASVMAAVLWALRSAGVEFRSLSRAAAAMTVPFVAVSLVFLGRALPHASMAEFYFGSDTFASAAESIIGLSVPGWERPFVHIWSVRVLGTLGAAALAGSLAWTAYAVFGRRIGTRGGSGPAVLSTALLLSAATLVLAHAAANVRYPYSRTGLYLVPLTVWTSVALASALRPALARWPAHAMVALAACVQFAAWRMDHYGDWPEDTDNKQVAARLAGALSAADAVCASWPLEPGLRYYTDRLRFPAPVYRDRWDEACTWLALLPEDHRLADDQRLAARGNLEVVFRGRLSGVLLVRRKPPAQPGEPIR